MPPFLTLLESEHQLCACRFFPDGQFVYRTSPDVVRNAVKSLQLSPGKSKADSQVERGLWRLNVSFCNSNLC